MSNKPPRRSFDSTWGGIPRVALVMLFVCGPLDAQSPADSKVADQRFADLLLEVAPKPISKSTEDRAKTPGEIKNEAKQQAQAARKAADDAKDFYTKNPNHPKAVDARRIEALAGLRGVQDGDLAQQYSALAVARTFRSNLAFPVKDRFEVALAIDRLELSLKAKVGRAAVRPEELKRLGDNLGAEFGKIPEIYSYYMEVARTANMAIAPEMAAEVIKSPVATPEAKTQARVILDRTALLGKKTNLKLDLIDGGNFDLAGQSSLITALVVWSPTAPETLSLLQSFDKLLPKDLQIVYLGLGGARGNVVRLKNKLPLPGALCYTPAGASSRAVSDALKLQYSTLPRLYLFDRSGNVAGFGTLNDLPQLLGRVAR